MRGQFESNRNVAVTLRKKENFLKIGRSGLKNSIRERGKRVSGYHVRRGPAAKEGWRKREARGNTSRTIRGKGLFSARGRMRGQAGKANKCNKGRGSGLGFLSGALVRQGCVPVQTCLFTALTDPVLWLNTALHGSFLQGEGQDDNAGGSPPAWQT